MKFSRASHWQFLEDELKAQTEEFRSRFEAPARRLLEDKGEMFVAVFESFHNGSMVMRFPNTRPLPRKGAHLLCMLLPKDLRVPALWGEKTYKDLYAARYKGSDCTCVFHGKCDDDRFSLVGFRGVDLDFSREIEQIKGIILVFAPQFPPLEYAANLQNVVKDERSPAVSAILDAEYSPRKWEPRLLDGKDDAAAVLGQMALTPISILQGPPGTGKTYTIAKVCADLCASGKSVLVTALTNRALVEIAAKPTLAPLLSAGKVSKIHLTVDESREVEGLKPAQDANPRPGELVLSTFYMASGYAAESTEDGLFDCVVMDEASQALMAMFAAASKLGKTNLWVGDINQLPPVVMLNPDRVEESGYQDMVDGLRLISCNREYPVMQLRKTYRLGARATKFTGMFYGDTLVSATPDQKYSVVGMEALALPEGGPVLKLVRMPLGKDAPAEGIDRVFSIVRDVLGTTPKKSLSILSHKVSTVVALQKAKVRMLGDVENVLVETVARIQGLTTDVVLYLIPNSSYCYSLERRLFNVATSRAREHTVIVMDESVFEHKEIDREVMAFLTFLRDGSRGTLASAHEEVLTADTLESFVDCDARYMSQSPSGENISPVGHSLADIQGLLDKVQVALCKWLDYYLRRIYKVDMWQKGVLNALSEDQRSGVLDAGVMSLQDLDLACLVSLFTANARSLRREAHVDPEMQDLIRLVKKIRNRYAHKGVRTIERADPADLNYHAETINRFLKGLGSVPSDPKQVETALTTIVHKGFTISVSKR